MSRSCGTNQLGHSFSSRALRKQWMKNRKKTPKMKCQLFRALLLLPQGHFCVTWLLFSCDNPGIKEKAAFPNRKQRKAGKFPPSFALFSWLICEHGDRVFSTHWIFVELLNIPFLVGRWGMIKLWSLSSLRGRPKMCWLGFLGRIKVF